MNPSEHPSYMAAFTAEQLAYFDAIPARAKAAWAKAAWALGVWGGILGSLLLLLRRRLAASVFLASLAGVVVLAAYRLALYARALATRDVLT